jgi:hypothetical protein
VWGCRRVGEWELMDEISTFLYSSFLKTINHIPFP